MESPSSTANAEKNIRDTVTIAFEHTPENRALVVYDEQSGLAKLLTEAYRAVLPDASFMNFDRTEPGEILNAFESLSPKDLVVLIQSESFRLSKFRIRIELFNRHLKVIEHPHLGRMAEDEFSV